MVRLFANIFALFFLQLGFSTKHTFIKSTQEFLQIGNFLSFLNLKFKNELKINDSSKLNVEVPRDFEALHFSLPTL